MGTPLSRKIERRAKALAKEHLSPRTIQRLKRVTHAVLGRRTAAVSRAGTTAAWAALHAGEYEEAAQHVNAVLRRDPNDVKALGLAAQVAIKQGEFTLAGMHATRRMERSRDLSHWSSARKLNGRVRETDPRWQPRIATPRPERPPREGRVLYLAKESRPFLHNGFCTRSHETLQSLVRSGRDVFGVTMPGFPSVLGTWSRTDQAGDGTDQAPPTRSVVEDVTYHHLLPSAGRALQALGLDEYVEITARSLAGMVARERPALLHASSGHRGFESALAANAVARWAGIPWMYEVRSFFEATWTSDPRYAERGEYFQRRFATETRMMRAADFIVTLSGPMRDEIVERHGVPRDKVRVIPNAVDLERFMPRERDDALRRRLGLEGTSTLGYVSNLSHPREGQEVLIKAVAELRAQGRRVTGLLVGDGGRRKELEALAKRLGVAGHVVFTGSVDFDEVAAYYAQIDLFVVPRVDDRAARMVSPMKPFEAMAMRVPLVVADLPALAEIVGPGADRGAGAGRDVPRGRVFTAGDPHALATVAAELLDRPEECARMVEAAAEWVARERTWSAVARAFGEVYDSLLESAARTEDSTLRGEEVP